MHVLPAALWGILTCAALILWAAVADGPMLLLLLCVPFVVSAVVVGLLVLSLLSSAWSWWRRRARARLRTRAP